MVYEKVNMLFVPNFTGCIALLSAYHMLMYFNCIIELCYILWALQCSLGVFIQNMIKQTRNKIITWFYMCRVFNVKMLWMFSHVS